MTFNVGDKVTVLLNTQCHGTVLNSTEAETDVKLNNGMTMRFKTEELRPWMFWVGILCKD